MKSLIYISVLTAALASCSGGSPSEQLRGAEEALAQGDMTAARSVADKLITGDAMDGMSATELARLSMVYMQMADEAEDNTALVATAADLYRRACRENADSAAAYFNSLPQRDAAVAAQLFHIVVATDSAGVIPDDEPLDSVM